MNQRASGIVERVVLIVGMTLLFGGGLAAQEAPDIVVFYREECNECRHMDALLDELLALYPEVSVQHIEEGEPGASDLMWALSSEYGIFPTKFPVIFVGDQVVVGSGRDKELQLRSAVRGCVFDGCRSPLVRMEREPFPLTTVAIVVAAVLTAAFLLLL